MAYNRLKHQGPNVEFPSTVNRTRIAYGRNGIGRHGLLCFNDSYVVTTFKNGKKSTFEISTSSGTHPLVVTKESIEDIQEQSRHGTMLAVVVEHHLPTLDMIMDIISARFLHDPEFKILVNGQSVTLENHSGLIESTEIKIDGQITLEVFFIDSHKGARTTKYQGIAFWQSARLVGEPSWILGNSSVIDGRIKFAKRYTFIVKTNDLTEYVNNDWTH